MKWLLITTIGKNPGDEWIRIGIAKMIDRVDPDREYILLDKEEPSIYKTPVKFDKCIWCGMPVFWSLGQEQNCRIFWWKDLMLGWPSERKNDFLVLGAGSFFPWGSELESITYREQLIKSAQDVMGRSYYVTARDSVVSMVTSQPIPHMICPAIFSIIDHKKSDELRLASLMPRGGHYSVFHPREAEAWDSKKYEISRILQDNGFIYVAHSTKEADFARKCGWRTVISYNGDPYALLAHYGRCGKFFGNRVHGAIVARGNDADVWSVGYDSRQEAVRLSGAKVSKPSELEIDQIAGWASQDIKAEPFNMESSFEKQVDIVRRFMFAAEEPGTRHETRGARDEGRAPSCVLFIRPDSIGDNVLASSMLPYIRRKYANGHITVVCQEHIAELYKACRYVDNIVVFDRRRALQDQRYRRQIIDHLRALKPDLSLNSVYSREPLTDVLAIESGATERIAFGGDLSNISDELRQKHNQFYTKILPSDGEHKSELARYRDFLHALGVEVSSLEPMVWTTIEDQEFADNLFQERGLVAEYTIALFPTAQWLYKVYQRYSDVVRNFRRFNFVILGGRDARLQAGEIFKSLPANCYDLTGRTTIRQMASIIRKCCLFLGSDSAGAHIACGVGTPNVVILGGGHFGRFFPYSPLTSAVCLPLECYGCNWKCRYGGFYCVKDIAPEIITEAVWQTLQRRSQKPRLFVQTDWLGKSKPDQPEWRAVDRFVDANAVEIIPAGCAQKQPTAETAENRLVIKNPAYSAVSAAKNEIHKGKYLVSAIVSTYNAERFIRGCLDDLENQTIADRLEIIVVNSGSQQNEEAIVKQFQQKYDNIKYIRTDERETIYRAWNRAIKIASGKYITNANADDRHSPAMLERLAAELDRNENTAVVYSQFYITTIENQTWQTKTIEKVAQWVRPYSREQLLKVYFLGPQPMWRKSLHDEYGYFDETFKVCGDYEFFLRVSQTHDFLFIPEPLGLYLLSPDGLEHTAGTKEQEDQKIWDLYRNNTHRIIRGPFVSVYSFEQLKVVNRLVESSDPLSSVFIRANEIEGELKEEIEAYLSSADRQQVDCYQHTFIRCLEKYLTSGLRFRNLVQINEFAKGVELSPPLADVPWFVGLLQSLWHLKNDTPHQLNPRPKSQPDQLGTSSAGQLALGQTEEMEQTVAVLVSIYNEVKFAELCLKAVRKYSGLPHYIIAVNNSTKDISHFKRAVLNAGLVDRWFDSNCYSHGEGLQRALLLARRFRYIATLDSDAVGLKQNWLRDLVEQLASKNAGLIGPQRVPTSKSIIEFVVHPCCMVIDQQRIGSEFQIDFRNQWPYWDVGGLLTWDCLLNAIPVVKVRHEYTGNSAMHSSLINDDVRHYWYASRISALGDSDRLDGYLVRDIRERLETEYQSPELGEIKEYCGPRQPYVTKDVALQQQKLSVVLTTFNRPELLNQVLSGFAGQTTRKRDFEVIVVDDGSEPPVEKLVQSYYDRMNVIYLRQQNSGPSVARNNGVKAARGQIVLFHDDDDLPAPDLIAEHLGSHQEYPDERIAVLGHLDWHRDLHISPLMHYITHVGGEYLGFDRLQNGCLYDVWKFWSGLVSAKRSLLQGIKGPFDGRLHWGYEDIELACRLSLKGVKVLYNARAKSFILRAIDFESFCKRRYIQGQALYQVASLHPEIIIPRYQLHDAANLYYSKYAPFLDEWSSKIIRFEELLNTQSYLQRTDIDRHLKSLYTVYHECFMGYWLKGYVEQIHAAQAGKVSLSEPVNSQPLETQSSPEPDCNQLTEPDVTEPLRITFISTNTPGFDIGSSNLRIYHILKILASKGHKIDYLYFGGYEDDSRYKAAFDGTINFIKVLGTANSFSDYLHFNKVEKLDCVWITNLWSVDYLGFAVKLTQWLKLHRPQTKVIIDTMDFHHKKFMRKYSVSHDNQDLLRAKQFLELEKRLYPLADEVLTVTEVERRDILENIGSDCDVSVIPNIHRILAQEPNLQQRKHICFLGSFRIRHNVDAVEWFLRAVFPRVVEKAPEVEFHILGFGNEKFKDEVEVSPSVKVIGYVEDAESAVANYRLFVCPMTYGAGMKGKLGTAAAAGTPVVTTTVGAEGFDFVDGQDCFIADEPQGFAYKCLRLLNENSLWSQFSTKAREMVAEKFSIKAASRKIQDLLLQLTAVRSVDERTADSVEVPAPSDYVVPTRAGPKVSIITSCRNSEKFLPECLESIRNQTMDQWELFLLDDGSTDCTKEVIEEYSRIDERIKPYYFQSNEGPYVRRNFAIEQANSDFIVVQDADDIMYPSKLEVLCNEITKDQQLGVVGSFFQMCLEEFKGSEYAESIELPTTHDKIMEQYSSTLYICWHGSAIIRKSLFETIGLYDENPFGSDTLWLAKAAEYARYSSEIKFKNIPKYLTIKREHAQSQQGMLPIAEPRSRRARFTIFWLHKLLKIREKLQQNPDVDIKIELRNCRCNDYIERYSSFFEQWESEPLGNNAIGQLLNTAVAFFNNRRYVTSITTLNGMEVSLSDIAKRFKNYDLLRAMASFAIDMKEQSLIYLNREIQNHNNPAAKKFISEYFGRHLKMDVQKWCAENSDLYDLQMIDTKTVPQTI